jgi:alpha-1,6-mannosyltransferase
VTLLLLPSLPSDDVFSYTLYGRISAVHHANPLVATPADFPDDPFLSLVFWRDVRSVYGPVWLLVSSGIALLAQALGGGLVVYVALFKLLGLAAHLGNALLIWAILGRLAPGRPDRQLFGTLLYAWNPLCLLEFCASAHNDALMLLLLLLGVYLLVRGWETAALVALGLSIATKYVPLVLLPFYLVYVGYRMRRAGADWARVAAALGGRLAVVLAVMALTAIPYWAGPRTLGSLLFSPPAQQLDNSLLESVSWPLRWLAQGTLHLSTAAARSLVDTALKVGALALFVLLWLRELRRATSLEGMLAAWGWVLLWYVLVASGWFWPWYVTWAVAVVALAAPGRLAVATLLTAAGALTLYAFLPLHASPIYGYRSVVAFAPALVYLAAAAWRRRETIFSAELAMWQAARRTFGRAMERTVGGRGS